MFRTETQEIPVVRIPAGKLHFDAREDNTVDANKACGYKEVFALARRKPGSPRPNSALDLLVDLVKNEEQKIIFFKPDISLVYGIAERLEEVERSQDPKDDYPYSYSIVAFSFKKDGAMTIRLRTALVDTSL